MNNVQRNRNTTEDVTDTSLDAGDKEHNHPDHIEVECIEVVNDADGSCVTVDGLVPEIPDPSGHLNSPVMTNQQTLLML